MANRFILLVTLFTLCAQISDVIGKIYDLSHTHKASTFVFENYPSYNRSAMIQGMAFPDVYVDNGYYVTSEHSGTHMDVPAHMFQGGKALEDITIEMTIADGVTIDCSQEAKLNQSYSMPLQKLLDWEQENGEIPRDAAVIINFGWSDKFTDHLAYRGSATTYDFPYLSDEAGLWLFNERGAKILAMDTFSPDSMNSAHGNTFHIHHAFLGHDRLIVENLKNPGQLPPRGFRFFAVPVKYQNSTGTQVRAFAVSLDDDIVNSRNSAGSGGGRTPHCLLFWSLMVVLSTGISNAVSGIGHL